MTAQLLPFEQAAPTVEDELRTLLLARDRYERQRVEAEALMLELRRRYAADRGEFLLPSLERLRRELLG